DPAQVPGAGGRHHLLGDRGQLAENGFGVAEQVAVEELRRDVGERAALVGRDKVEQIGRGRREPLDAQVAVEENGRDVGAGQEVGEVAVDRLQLQDFLLKLVVDRGQFLV